MPWRPHLPECPKSTKNYNSQNPPLASHTHSSQHAVGTTAVTAPLPGVWQLHVTTLWVSLVLEDELIVD